jgi:hypothetical protein
MISAVGVRSLGPLNVLIKDQISFDSCIMVYYWKRWFEGYGIMNMRKSVNKKKTYFVFFLSSGVRGSTKISRSAFRLSKGVPRRGYRSRAVVVAYEAT